MQAARVGSPDLPHREAPFFIVLICEVGIMMHELIGLLCREKDLTFVKGLEAYLDVVAAALIITN